MDAPQRKTLQAVFSSPVPQDLPWADLESLLRAAGASLTEGDGARVAFDREGVTLTFHRPCALKTARAYQVALTREFLESAGVGP